MITLNEKEYAEDCLKRKQIDDKPFYTLSILAKYYYHCFGYRKAKITELLTDFMEKHYARYDCNKTMWNESIEKIAKNAGKYTLFEIDGVWITKAELDTISNIHNKVLERLAFTLLCLAKLGNAKNPNNSGWVNNDAKEIFSLARISCSVDGRYEKLGELQQLSMLEFPRRIDNLSCRVTYINDDSEKILFISDFRELGFEYLKYTGENILLCRECGALFRPKHGNERYCTKCKNRTMIIKRVECVDCGRTLVVNSKNNRSHRCSECQEIHEKKLKRRRNKRYYNKIKNGKRRLQETNNF